MAFKSQYAFASFTMAIEWLEGVKATKMCATTKGRRNAQVVSLTKQGCDPHLCNYFCCCI
jgi:hypothetical protein